MKRWSAAFACAALAALAAAVVPATATAGARPQTHTHPLVGATAPLPVQPRLAGHGALAAPSTSFNWAGYDATGGPFTSVTATWIQPRVRLAASTMNDVAFWVGLDGDTSNTVEQIGSEGFNQNGVVYDAWYELYPAAPVTVPLTIRPGDVLTGAVSTPDGITFTVSLADRTSGKSFQTTQTVSPAAALSSAEVIAEAPSDDLGNVVPLANFGLVRFSSSAFNGRPISAFTFNQIDMTDAGGALIARTSALGADGASFTVASDLTAPTTKVSGAGTAWHDKSVTLHFTAHDNRGGTGVAYTEHSVDGGTTWTKGSTLAVRAPRDHANDGVHTILYRSADRAGNVEHTRKCTVKIDTRRPTPVAKWAGAAVRGARTALRFSVGDPRPGSPTATVTIRIVDSRGRLAKKAVLAAVKVGTPRNYVFTCWLAGGRYRFFVYATDAAGNSQSRVADNRLVVR
jgi:hypothetical protein